LSDVEARKKKMRSLSPQSNGKASDALGSKRFGAQEQVSEEQEGEA